MRQKQSDLIKYIFDLEFHQRSLELTNSLMYSQLIHIMK